VDDVSVIPSAESCFRSQEYTWTTSTRSSSLQYALREADSQCQEKIKVHPEKQENTSKTYHTRARLPRQTVSPTKHITNGRYLEIVLFSAERAWSQSTSLKTDDLHQKKRHHIGRRLKKAVRHAEHLSTLVEAEGVQTDTITRLESRAYKAMLAGQRAFERKHWDVALREYSIAKVILEVLLSKCNENDRAVYKEASTTVDPGLRYCGYQLQTGSQGDILSLARSHLPQDATLLDLLKEINPSILETRRDSAARAGISSIQWRSLTVNLEYPEIVVSLLKVQDTQTAYNERTAAFDLSATEKAAAMDEILNAWAEAEDTTRKIIEEVGATRQDKEQNLQIILTYVSFHFIATRLQRDVLLVKNLEGRRGIKMPVLKDLVQLQGSVIQVQSFLTCCLITEHSTDI
jgi:signal recognition particle subunit SRP68